MAKFFFTSESVTEGHPDKVCDKISDAVLDSILEQDKTAHVACETTVTTGMVHIMGEISTTAQVDITSIARGVIEDIGYIINTFLDEQDNGNIPMPILFIWDSIGSIQSYKSLVSKTGNNQFDAGAINVTFKPIFARIAASKEVGAPYTNGMIAVNKIWKDNMNSMGGATAIANSGGEAFKYGCRLGIHVGGVATAGTKKLKATVKGNEIEYGTLTKISVYKNQLPTPYNITYNGTMCCVHSGIISEDDIPEYKKKEIPKLLEKLNLTDGQVDASEITFSEVGKLSDEVVPVE